MENQRDNAQPLCKSQQEMASMHRRLNPEKGHQQNKEEEWCQAYARLRR